MALSLKQTITAIKDNLTDELRLPKYRGNQNKFAGHCYIASEALFYLSSRKLKPMFIRHEGEPHWFLKDSNGHIIDITASQFATPPDYNKAVGKGFLTKYPSKRTKTILRKIDR